ncbi:hypothetical protein JCM8097_005677 [Rhodosporidiobolus ruineniae]
MLDRRLQRALALSSYFLTLAAAAAPQMRFASTDCIDSATGPEINHLLKAGGEGTAIVLCPYAQVSLDSRGEPITFTARGQSIYTRGFPEDHSRATIVIEHHEGERAGELTTAIEADCDVCGGITIQSLHVDGGAEQLLQLEGGDALIKLGGKVGEQTLRSVDAWGARGFAVVHASEGAKGSCRDVIVDHNVLHTAGNAPLDAFLNSELARLRDGTPAHIGQERPGTWTDGISIACAHSTVTDNTIRDVSGVGIALRGGPGSEIRQNTVVARDRDMLVGISVVANPIFHGKAVDIGQILIAENRIHAASAMIRIGISTGAGSWSTDEILGDHMIPPGTRIQRNRLSSYTGYYAYAIALSDAWGILVEDNAISASIWGFETSSCYTRPAFVAPAPLLFDPRSAQGSLQPGFVDKHFGFLLCVGPGTASASMEMSRHQINDASVRSYHSSVRNAAPGGRNGRGRGRPADIPAAEWHPRVQSPYAGIDEEARAAPRRGMVRGRRPSSSFSGSAGVAFGARQHGGAYRAPPPPPPPPAAQQASPPPPAAYAAPYAHPVRAAPAPLPRRPSRMAPEPVAPLADPYASASAAAVEDSYDAGADEWYADEAVAAPAAIVDPLVQVQESDLPLAAAPLQKRGGMQRVARRAFGTAPRFS